MDDMITICKKLLTRLRVTSGDLAPDALILAAYSGGSPYLLELLLEAASQPTGMGRYIVYYRFNIQRGELKRVSARFDVAVCWQV
jgi:hypothetical protein